MQEVKLAAMWHTCAGDGKTSSQEVEGAVGGVHGIPRQSLEVALGGEATGEVSAVGGHFAVGHGVRSVSQRLQERPVAQREFRRRVVTRTQWALVTRSGQVRLDRKQVGVFWQR